MNLKGKKEQARAEKRDAKVKSKAAKKAERKSKA